jgi:hypothetical protein
MDWARILAFVTGVVDQELLARNEYLAAENHILKAKLKGRLTATANRPILAPDERSLQVDLVRLDRTVPGAGRSEHGMIPAVPVSVRR